eukprot:CAMPEP_0114548542 /NCGR_PEP_ID=MMETSP0114-20121206/5039_1 /TAXON_ID=31324 /ORGANISM="Goniomonas sp, Strain m" /LENGTH=551 /DNA_ID=CAMNT_0001733143 /DNA_START=111 /DNA_END=1766 /DNA_ORIENTATION=+
MAQTSSDNGDKSCRQASRRANRPEPYKLSVRTYKCTPTPARRCRSDSVLFHRSNVKANDCEPPALLRRASSSPPVTTKPRLVETPAAVFETSTLSRPRSGAAGPPSLIPANAPIIIFDLDQTLVGDLQPHSDRDNLEANLPWSMWPQGQHRGVSQQELVELLDAGMMRPGTKQLIQDLKKQNAVIVIYTHSEQKWAQKVVAALQACVGTPFVHRLFTRQDCRDGHPEWTAKKCLLFVLAELGLEASDLGRVIMFEDDPLAVPVSQRSRLAVVPPYTFYAHTPWDSHLTPHFLSTQPAELAARVSQAAREWGLAAPHFGLERGPAEIASDLEWTQSRTRWSIQRSQMNIVLLREQLLTRTADFVSKGQLMHLPVLLRQLVRMEQTERAQVERASAMLRQSATAQQLPVEQPLHQPSPQQPLHLLQPQQQQQGPQQQVQEQQELDLMEMLELETGDPSVSPLTASSAAALDVPADAATAIASDTHTDIASAIAEALSPVVDAESGVVLCGSGSGACALLLEPLDWRDMSSVADAVEAFHGDDDFDWDNTTAAA